MEELIEINNQLHDVLGLCKLLEFNLPQIVVVGAQSSGKSSVLEHLVGRSFLPRGVGIVTRCPLELRLVNIKDNSNTSDYAVFQHKKTEVFTDYHEITKEIENQTELLAGEAKGICSTPICLKMYSKTFTNLTLVDLPGLTKVPVGDQPEDIEQQTRDLILKYIRNENSIILAVVPANADMATCESLKIAREVDPEGVRTLAVVTKLDIMDEGTDAMDMLSGKVIPVKLGIIGVVNRSQKGILQNKSMEQSLKDEEKFFSKNYKGLKSIHGTAYLTKTIQNVLISKIKSFLPDLKQTIIKELQQKGTQLHNLEKLNSNNPNFLPNCIVKFYNNFCNSINGKLSNIDTKQLTGGANIYKALRKTDENLEKVKPLKGKSKRRAKQEVLLAIQNAHGINVTCYIPKEAFERLVKNEIELLRSPCVECVDLVYKELMKIIDDCVNDPELQLRRYPILKNELSAKTIGLLESHLTATKEMLKNFLDMNSECINYNQTDFSPSHHKYLPNGEVNEEEAKDISPGEEAISSEEEVDESNYNSVYKDTVNSIESYFTAVKKSIKDMLPKIITLYLVYNFKDKIQTHLMTELYSSSDSDLLQESSDYLQMKNELKEEISVLEEANDILNNLDSCHRKSPKPTTNNSSQDTPSFQEIPTSQEIPSAEQMSSSDASTKKLNYILQIMTWLCTNNDDGFNVPIKICIVTAVVAILIYFVI